MPWQQHFEILSTLQQTSINKYVEIYQNSVNLAKFQHALAYLSRDSYMLQLVSFYLHIHLLNAFHDYFVYTTCTFPVFKAFSYFSLVWFFVCYTLFTNRVVTWEKKLWCVMESWSICQFYKCASLGKYQFLTSYPKCSTKHCRNTCIFIETKSEFHWFTVLSVLIFPLGLGP